MPPSPPQPSSRTHAGAVHTIHDHPRHPPHHPLSFAPRSISLFRSPSILSLSLSSKLDPTPEHSRMFFPPTHPPTFTPLVRATHMPPVSTPRTPYPPPPPHPLRGGVHLLFFLASSALPGWRFITVMVSRSGVIGSPVRRPAAPWHLVRAAKAHPPRTFFSKDPYPLVDRVGVCSGDLPTPHAATPATRRATLSACARRRFSPSFLVVALPLATSPFDGTYLDCSRKIVHYIRNASFINKRTTCRSRIRRT